MQTDPYGSIRACEDIPFSFPPQHQDKQPGLEYRMDPRPVLHPNGGTIVGS